MCAMLNFPLTEVRKTFFEERGVIFIQEQTTVTYPFNSYISVKQYPLKEPKLKGIYKQMDDRNKAKKAAAQIFLAKQQSRKSKE